MSYYHKRSWHENYEKTWSDPRRCKLPYRLKSMRNVAEEIMAQVNLSSETAKQSETLAQLRCVAGWADGIHKPIITLSIINIFLSITAFLGNFLILVALHKESSLHSPSKFLYRCLATTDLCVGLISEPSAVMYWLSLERILEFLSLYANHTFCSRFYTSISFPFDNDRSKCRQTSRPNFGAEIQTSCDFKANIFASYHLLDCFFDSRCDIVLCESPYSYQV